VGGRQIKALWALEWAWQTLGGSWALKWAWQTLLGQSIGIDENNLLLGQSIGIDENKDQSIGIDETNGSVKIFYLAWKFWASQAWAFCGR